MPDNHTTEQIPLTVAQAIAASAAATLEEARASRREVREELRLRSREVAALREQISALAARVEPALSSYAKHLDRLQESHTETLQERADAHARLGVVFTTALTSKPALVAWGAFGTALAAALARHFGV